MHREWCLTSAASSGSLTELELRLAGVLQAPRVCSQLPELLGPGHPELPALSSLQRVTAFSPHVQDMAPGCAEASMAPHPVSVLTAITQEGLVHKVRCAPP